jgi:hypothetical protein
LRKQVSHLFAGNHDAVLQQDRLNVVLQPPNLSVHQLVLAEQLQSLRHVACIIFVRLFPRVLDDAKLVPIQYIAGSTSGLDSISPPESPRASPQDHGVLGIQTLDVLPWIVAGRKEL